MKIKQLLCKHSWRPNFGPSTYICGKCNKYSNKLPKKHINYKSMLVGLLVGLFISISVLTLHKVMVVQDRLDLIIDMYFDERK
jgi:hypothetical protein